jgi:acetyltransferase-like isoleucine patch superfamily enzyme
MDKLILLYKVFFSYLRILFIKTIYGSRIKFNIFKKIYFGKSINVEVKKDSFLTIGENFITRNFCNLKVTGGRLKIGKNVFMNNGVSINCHQEIEIGDNTIFGEGIKVYDHDHRIENEMLYRDSGYVKKKVKIGKNVWIGSNVVVLKGSIIGENCVIGAGSIVRGEIEENTIYYNEVKKKSKIIKGE